MDAGFVKHPHFRGTRVRDDDPSVREPDRIRNPEEFVRGVALDGADRERGLRTYPPSEPRARRGPLVLDEPTEGLDPNQRVEIRHLINQLGEERTVLLSTHVLAEVEATGGRLIIIHEGRLVADGTVAELLEGLRSGARYRVEAKGEDVARTLSALEGVSSHESAPVDDRVRVDLTASGPADLRPTIFETATRKGWTLWELHRERDSLEELFRELTSGHAPAADRDGPSTSDQAPAAGPAAPPSSGSPAEEDGGTDTGGEG